MKFCTACGHELGDGRFCTHCGAPVGGDDPRTDTAERPAVPGPVAPAAPVPPPPASASAPTSAPTSAPPSPPSPTSQSSPPTPTSPPTSVPASDDYSGRFPLFADEAAEGDQTAVLPTYEPVPEAAEPDVLPWSEEEPVGRGLWPVFLTIGVVLALAVAGGIWLLGSGDDSPGSARPDRPGASSRGGSSSGTPDGDVTAPDNPGNLARTATATAPVTAPPNQDLSGDVVRYVASNMLDGVASTAWRMPGDGTGATLTFTLPEESVLTKVGLVNGYAKLDHDRSGRVIDWYRRNRKVMKVEWGFDDGSTVTQELGRGLKMQTVTVGPVATTTIRLRIVTVSPPGPRNGRNYTPISDVALIGG